MSRQDNYQNMVAKSRIITHAGVFKPGDKITPDAFYRRVELADQGMAATLNLQAKNRAEREFENHIKAGTVVHRMRYDGPKQSPRTGTGKLYHVEE